MYFHSPSNGELLGCFAIVAGFFIGLGVLLALGLPWLWDLVKPWLYAITG